MISVELASLIRVKRRAVISVKLASLIGVTRTGGGPARPEVCQRSSIWKICSKPVTKSRGTGGGPARGVQRSKTNIFDQGEEESRNECE